MVEILEDIVQLYNKRCNIDCPENSSMFNKYMFYFRELMIIISKNERLFYVGILLFIIGLLLNFIDLSKV